MIIERAGHRNKSSHIKKGMKSPTPTAQRTTRLVFYFAVIVITCCLRSSCTHSFLLRPQHKSQPVTETRTELTSTMSSQNDINRLTQSIVLIDKPDDANVIVGQTHFIKTVDDIHEALVGSVPGIKFGLAFCEASGERLVRWTGTDTELIELAKRNASSIGCGHSFVLFLGPPTFPIHILNTLKTVPEVCRIFCATANQVEVIVGETSSGRGIMGVIDGQTPLGVETNDDIAARRQLLKTFGYKL